MNIEEIIKPYFDKKSEIDKKGEMEIINQIPTQYDDLTQQRVFLELRLEKLRDNKEAEIEEYVKNSVSNNPDFYVGYGAMIRKDLEQAYFDKEQELETQIKNINSELEKVVNDINVQNERKINEAKEAKKFHNVDIKELIEIKSSLRKKLFKAKRELEFNFEETKLNFDNVMLKLSRHELVGEEYRRLFDQSNNLIEVKYNLEKQLKLVNEYLSMTELTQEEIKVSMMPLTSWEMDEYNRRRASISTLEETIKPEVEEITELQVESPQTFEPEIGEVKSSIEELVTDEKNTSETEKELYDFEPVIEDSLFNDEIEEQEEYNYEKPEGYEGYVPYLDFIDNVYKDVLASANNLRSIEIKDGVISTESMEMELSEETVASLPNGVYLSKKDIYSALDNYGKKNKGRTFTIDGIDKSFEVNTKTIRDVKKSLREYSIKKLLVDNKLGFGDIKRIYGKDQAEQYRPSIKELKRAYISLDEFAASLKKLFSEKSPSWLEKLSQAYYNAKENKEYNVKKKTK